MIMMKYGGTKIDDMVCLLLHTTPLITNNEVIDTLDDLAVFESSYDHSITEKVYYVYKYKGEIFTAYRPKVLESDQTIINLGGLYTSLGYLKTEFKPKVVPFDVVFREAHLQKRVELLMDLMSQLMPDIRKGVAALEIYAEASSMHAFEHNVVVFKHDYLMNYNRIMHDHLNWDSIVAKKRLKQLETALMYFKKIEEQTAIWRAMGVLNGGTKKFRTSKY